MLPADQITPGSHGFDGVFNGKTPDDDWVLTQIEGLAKRAVDLAIRNGYEIRVNRRPDGVVLAGQYEITVTPHKLNGVGND